MVHRIFGAPRVLENLCIPVHIRLKPILRIINNFYTATLRFVDPCSWEQGVMGKSDCDVITTARLCIEHPKMFTTIHLSERLKGNHSRLHHGHSDNNWLQHVLKKKKL